MYEDMPENVIKKPRFKRGYQLASRYKFKNYLDVAHLIAKGNTTLMQRKLKALELHLKNYNSLVRTYSEPLPKSKDDPSADRYAPLSQGAINEMARHLRVAQKMTVDYLKTTSKKDSLYPTMRKMNDLLGNELKLYGKYDPNTMPTFSDFLQSAKAKSLTLSDTPNNIQKLGGCLSTRQLLKFNEGGQTRRGLFTERSTFDYEKTFENNLVDWKVAAEVLYVSEEQQRRDLANLKDTLAKENYIEQTQKTNAQATEFKRFFDVMESARQSYDPTMSPADFYLEAFNVKTNAARGSYSIRVNDAMPPEIAEYVDKNYNTNMNFRVFYESALAPFLSKEKNKISQYSRIHDLNVGDRIDSRSSAMSAVASLFGQDKLLAKSESMNLKHPNGRVIKGTFMDFADGVDLLHLNAADPYVGTQGDEIIESGRGLKSIADLGVLDYICGNTDRHEANMLYQFDENGKFTGVVGIDNDMSFGNLTSGRRVRGGEPEDLQVISEEMAAAIKKVTPDEMRLALHGYGLSEKDLNCAVARMKTVQNMLDPDTKGPKLRAVRDDEWDGIRLQDLNKDKPGIAEKLAKSPNKQIKEQDRKVESIFLSASLGNHLMKEKRAAFAKNHIARKAQAPSNRKFAETTVGHDAATEDYSALSAKMNNMLEKLQKANKGLFIGSKEYDNMLNYATYMNEELRKMAVDPKLSYETCYMEQYKILENENNGKSKDADEPADRRLEDEALENLAAKKASEIINEREKECFERAQIMFGTMRDITGMYIQHRKSDNKLQTSDTARTRTLAATDLYSFVDNNCKKFSVTPEEMYRQGLAEQRQRTIRRELSADIRQRSAKDLGIKGDEIYAPGMEKEKAAVFGQMNAKNIRDQIKALRSIKDPAQRAEREKQFRQYLTERKEDAIKSHLAKQSDERVKEQEAQNKKPEKPRAKF